MATLTKLVIVSLVFSVTTTLSLIFWPTWTNAKEHAVASVASASAAEGALSQHGGNSPAAKAIASTQGGQSLGPGVIYAPRDVVDMARLVLESTRDQTSHLASYIERATTIIVVFFSVLGAAGAVYGLRKIDDIEKKAAALSSTYEHSIKSSMATVEKLEGEFLSLVNSSTGQIHREITDQIDLMQSRLEIFQAESPLLTKIDSNRMLQTAFKRIEKIVSADHISAKAKIRGLADLAYSAKRLGDLDCAYKSVSAAIDTAKSNFQESLALLNYNAACYSCLMGKNNVAIAHLTEAVGLDRHYKDKAAVDEDFAKVKDQPEFKGLIN